MLGSNVTRHADLFESEVKMYVHEEEVRTAPRPSEALLPLSPLPPLTPSTPTPTLPQVKGRKLTEIINTDHENVKYLPGVKLPENIVATASAVDAAKGADLLIFVLPHQVSWRSAAAFDLALPLQPSLTPAPPPLLNVALSPASSSSTSAKSSRATSPKMRVPSR